MPFALDALATANYLSGPQVASAVSFLVARQGSGGGWSDGINEPSVFVTALGLQALLPYRATYESVASAIRNAQSYLLAHRAADGLWDEDFVSGAALLALAGSLSDLSAIAASEMSLRARQHSDGNWAGDPYTTAVVLRALAALEARRTPAPSLEGSIAGEVRRAGSTEPIAAATVGLAELPGASISTTGDGQFLLPALPPGDYTLTARKAGYASAGAAVRVQAGQTTIAGPLLLEVLPEGGLVYGLVFDATTRAPLAAVQVTLTGPSTRSLVSDANGRFDFGPVVPGSYGLSFAKTGYLTVAGTATVVAGQTLVAQLGLTFGGGFIDDGPGTVRGRIVDGKTGLPLAGALFTLAPGLFTTSGGDGNFAVAKVPRASYQGVAEADGYRAVAFALAFSPGASGDIGTLALFPTSTGESPRTLTLHGRVVDGVTGAGLAGASVYMVGGGATATAGADGRFDLPDLTSKTFSLAVSASGYATATFDFEVAAFGEASVTLRLPPPGTGATFSTLTGVVTDQATGAPVAGAQVTVVGTSAAATTGSDGRYSLPGIDRLDFILEVAALGYRQQTANLKLAQHGTFTRNFQLQPVPAESFQVVSVQAERDAWAANSTALFSARVASLLPGPKSALILGEVQDAAGNAIATVTPYVDGTTQPAADFSFAAGEEKALKIPWSTAQHAPGSYRLVVRVVERGTISTATPLGEVLADGSARTTVIATQAIGGALAILPPITQAGLPTPVSFTALVRNAGNVPLERTAMVLTVKHPDTGATLFTAEVPLPMLAAGASGSVPFGSWVPTASGNLSVSVRAKEAGVAGQIVDRLYVGDKASGAFAVDRSVVPEGTQMVRGNVDVQGIDITQVSSSDPLVKLVADAIKRGAAYVGPAAVSWHTTHRCLACHIQTQSLLGLSTVVERTAADDKAMTVLYNAITTSQRRDGSLWAGSLDGLTTQTNLAVWSLGAWPDRASVLRTKHQAARFLLSRKTRSGDLTWWGSDHFAGWWDSNESQTALAIKGFADVLKSATRVDLGTVADYSIKQGASLGPGGIVRDMDVDASGRIYMLRADGRITRLEPATGALVTVATGFAALGGLAVGADGTVFVALASRPAATKILPDGSRITLPVTGSFFDAAVGRDGALYLAEPSQRRIRRLRADGAVDTFAAGGLLVDPNGLTFDEGGNLLVANTQAHNILSIAPTGAVSVFADGLSVAPQRLARGANGVVYAACDGEFPSSHKVVLRVHPDGLADNVMPIISGASNVIRFGPSWSIAEVGGHLYVTREEPDPANPFDPSRWVNRLDEIEVGSMANTSFVDLSSEIPFAVRYLLAGHQDGSPSNVVQALRLVGLAEGQSVIGDPALRSQVDGALASIETLLRARQRADGGWGRNVNRSSDPLSTAMVGIALQYRNPSPKDAQLRKAIQYLLDTQQLDGSWTNVANGFSTRLAATSFVMIFMPKALEQLGGMDIDLHLDLASTVQLTNPSPAPTTITPGANGGVEYVWRLAGVTAASRQVAFDLQLVDLGRDERRPVARAAFLEFDNSFLPEKIRLPLDVPVVRSQGSQGLAVSTDRGGYQGFELVSIQATVSNTGLTPAAGQLQLAIRPAGSTSPIVELPPLPVAEIGPGAQRALAADWNTGATLAGSYEVHGRLFDTRGRLVAESVALFTIAAPADAAATSVITDRAVYDAWDLVDITGRVRNVAINAYLAPSHVKLTVVTPAGETLMLEVRPLPQLAPRAIIDLPFRLPLADAPLGQYLVRLELDDDFTRASHDISVTSFLVERRALTGLAGSVTVETKTVTRGDRERCTERARNLAATMAPGVRLVHRLVGGDAGTLLHEVAEIVDLPPGGQERVYLREVDTAPLAAGSYACVLLAESGGVVRTLGSAAFQVAEPPIRVAGALMVRGRGRLLVLLDPQQPGANGDDDPLGPQQAPPLTLQRQRLEALLTTAGWSYTITDSAAGFTTELQSGGYTTYALFAEQEKLSEEAQQKLREAIFRGEGLLVAGDHDSRDQRLHDALGVRYIGDQRDAESLLPVGSGSPLPAAIPLLTQEHPRRIERLGASPLAVYLLKGGGTADAAAFHAYGRGKAAFVGADLVAILARDGLASAAADGLGALLDLVGPADVATGPGAVVPVELAVTNQGIAAPVTATVSLPAGATVVDAAGGVVSGQRVAFAFALAVAEVKTVRFWVRLPLAPGPLAFEATVSAGLSGQAFSLTVGIPFTVVNPETLSTLQGKLDALARAAPPYARPLSHASRWVGHAIEHPEQAIRDVLSATDALLGISDSRVVELRAGVGVWLRAALAGSP